jgi:acetolactate synthase I/II/III large subunit
MHQERVAKERGRPVENKWIGQRIDEPDIDIAMMARAQGAIGIGPIRELAELKPAIERAIGEVKKGAVCVVDVRVLPGYDAPVAGAGAAVARR